MGGRAVSRPYRGWFFAEGVRFLSFWRCHRPLTRSVAKGCFFMFLFQSPSISPLSQRQPIITMITGCPSYPRRESNPDLRFRKPSFYPLNYGGIA